MVAEKNFLIFLRRDYSYRICRPQYQSHWKNHYDFFDIADYGNNFYLVKEKNKTNQMKKAIYLLPFLILLVLFIFSSGERNLRVMRNAFCFRPIGKIFVLDEKYEIYA